MDQADNLREQVSRRASSAPPRVIAITSAKGGVGKTNFTVNLAVQASRAGQSVLILDGDLGLGNVEILFGIKPQHHLGQVLDAAISIRDALSEGPEGISVLPAGSGLQKLTRLDDEQKLRLAAALDSLDDAFDLVLVDSGAGIGDNVLFFAGAAHEVILILNPEPTALTDAYAAVEILSMEVGVQSFQVVVNPATGEAQARDVFRRLSTVTAQFLSARLNYLGFIPRDENIHRAVMMQRPLVQVFPHSPASRAVAKICTTLLHQPPPSRVNGGMKFLWGRVFRGTQPVR